MEYRFANLTELANAIRLRQVSSAELAEEALALLSTLGPYYNAVANLLHDRARRAATAADRRLSSGDQVALCGIPYGAKDVFAARGAPTTWGSAVFAGQVFDSDADVIASLSEDGAVLVAKLAMSEFAGGGRAERLGSSLHGQGRNPWNPKYSSGGSSSGSAIAVATGLVPFALGTETGGSIVGPAAFCGITGVRPTSGTVSRSGVMTLSWSLDKVGPLARSADDCALVLESITENSRGFVRVKERHIPESIRVAFSPHEIDEIAPPMRRAIAKAVDEFRKLYPKLIDLELKRDAGYIAALDDIIRIEAAFEFRDHLRRPDFKMSDERQLASLRSGLRAAAPDYIQAVRVQVPNAASAFARLFERADVILSVSRATTAPPLDEPRSPRDATKISDLLRAAANLIGLPGVSFPCGLSDDSLPVGLQLIGPRDSESLLLSMVSAFQQATGHHLRRPPDPDLY